MKCRAVRFVLAITAFALACTACGSDDGNSGAGGSIGPTVAPLALDGSYRVVALQVENVDVPVTELEVDGSVEVVIDAEFGGLRVTTACGILLGSYSLLADGQAGATIAGGSRVDCSPTAVDQRDALEAAFGRIDAWQQSPDTDSGGGSERDAEIDLTSSAGDLVSLRR